MAVGGRSARGTPRDQIKVVERTRKARAREIEAIVRRRAEGMGKERIARELKIEPARVGRILEKSRAAGDARALTDRQAAALCRARVERAKAAIKAKARKAVDGATPAAPALPSSPPPPPALAPRRPAIRAHVRRTPTLAAFADAHSRDWYVAMLRERGEAGASAAHRGLLHLVDLYEHCPTFYPVFDLRDEGGTATLASTERLFPRAGTRRSVHSSPAALCLDA